MSLKPAKRNARTHSKAQIERIADSIQTFGFTNPVLLDKEGRIIAGHGRVEAAKLLDIKEVPTLMLEHLSAEEVRAYIIADNKLAELAGWDDEILRLELGELDALDLTFDLTVTGFDTAEIDLLLSDDEAKEPDAPIPALQEGPAVTSPGDLWLIGPHKLYCGDSTQEESFKVLFDKEDRAQMIFTDPPYNVPISGHICGLGSVQHREFAMAAGEMTSEEFTSFLNKSFTLLANHSMDGSLHFICMDWRHIKEVMDAATPIYSNFKNLCIWNKTNGGMGSLYRSQHELVFVFKHGQGKHVNNVELGKNGRHRTNVWTYAGINAFSDTRDEDLKSHPTVKPVAMVEDAIKDCSNRKDIILDAFAGSGTTFIAAHRAVRICYGIEYDPLYCDVILKRLEKEKGLIAIHAATGHSFDERLDHLNEEAT